MSILPQTEEADGVRGPEDFVDVDTRASALGLNAPTGLCLLPYNFEDAATAGELLYQGDAATVRILFRQAGVVETRLEPEGKRTPVLHQKSVDLVVPTLFVAGSMLTENPTAVNVALSVLANYITDFFKGHGSDKRVRFSIVTKDKGGRYRCYKYSGDPSGIKDFTKLATRLDNGASK
jgi:hypothetical protein